MGRIRRSRRLVLLRRVCAGSARCNVDIEVEGEVQCTLLYSSGDLLGLGNGEDFAWRASA